MLFISNGSTDCHAIDPRRPSYDSNGGIIIKFLLNNDYIKIKLIKRNSNTIEFYKIGRNRYSVRNHSGGTTGVHGTFVT